MLYRLDVATPEAVQNMLYAVERATGLIVKVSLRKGEEYVLLSVQDRERRGSEESFNGCSFLSSATRCQDWQRLEMPGRDEPRQLDEPFIRAGYHHLLACAVAPILKERQVVGEVVSGLAVVKDTFDWQEHRRYAQRYDLAWPAYQTAIESVPHVTLDQLTGISLLLGIAAKTLAELPLETIMLDAQAPDQRLTGTQHTYWKEITRQAIIFMHENLENPISVAEVSHAVALTPAYFSMLFSEQVGCSPCDYLIQLRLERAKQYLASTHMPIKEVGVALGYSRSYFSRLFKRQVGCTPSQYAHRVRTRRSQSG